MGLLLVCAELVLRMAHYVPYYLDSRAFMASQNPQMVYELKPGFRGLYAGVPISISSMGFRENGQNGQTDERSTPRLRVLTIGDSITFGQGVGDDATLAQQIKAKLKERGISIDVQNLGIPGYDTCQEYWLYKERGMHLKHDAVLHIYYENDTDPPVFRVVNGAVISPDTQLGRFHAVAAWARKHSLIYNVIWTRWQVFKHRMNTTDHYLTMLATKFSEHNPGWQRSKACLKDLVALAQSRSIRVIVIPFPIPGLLNEKPYPLNHYIESVCKAAEANKAACLDVVPSLQQSDMKLTVSSVEDHPSAEVYQAVADQVAAFVQHELAY
jgi:GDSL-like Lipase/Acylhydrolase family